MYADNGAQIISPVDKMITAQIEANLAPWEACKRLYALSDAALEAALPSATTTTATCRLDIDDEATHAYIAAISAAQCRHRELNVSSPRVCYTAMHGVGTPFSTLAFAAFGLPPFVLTPEQVLPDPEFRTVKFPNPEEGKGALACAMAAATAAGATLILANDPDADRLAVAEWVAKDGAWRVFTGNEIGALLADWEWRCYLEQQQQQRMGDRETTPAASEGGSLYPHAWMVASTVSSGLLRAMAAEEGFSAHGD